MTPLYFGTSDHPLFGVYHPPKGDTVRDSGILLCYPFGHEYMRSHRAFRQLSLLLSRAGYHVFRFDYYGTGDSGGRTGEGDIGQWLEDIDVAIEELQATAGIEKVSLVGLRLGAALVTLAAKGRGDIPRVVLWDPIVQGAPYIQELLESRSEYDGELKGDASLKSTIHGFPLTEHLVDSMSGLDLLQEEAGDTDFSILVARELPQYSQIADHFRKFSGAVDYEVIPAPDNWNEVDDFGSVLLPQQVIQGIVTRFDQETSANA